MEPLKRVRYFPGKLLTAEDLQAEQEYLLEKQRRHNLGALGSGVVSGLEVSAGPHGIQVAAGLAIDGLGREIILTDAALVPYPPVLLQCRLLISYRETPTDPVPAPTWGSVEYTRIEEGFLLETVAMAPVGDGSLILATLEHTSRGWRVLPARSVSGLWAVAAALGLGFLLAGRVPRN